MKFRSWDYKKFYRREVHDFLELSSIHGLRVSTMQTCWRYARRLWIILMVSIVLWTHFIIVNLIINYLQQPTEIHMSTKLVHVQNSEFPAVAICSANKISKKKLMAFAEKVARNEKDNELIRNSPKIKFQSNSILNSIQIVLQSNPEEFVYKEFVNDAFQLFIFPQQDYAILQSTKVGDIFVNHNTIVEIPIQPKFFGANPAVRQFTPRLRQCYYPDEGAKLLNQSYYSIDECLLYCRIESMIQHCGCVSPPMLHLRIKRQKPSCELIDLPCLMRWKSVWYNWNYFDYVNRQDEISEQMKYTNFERCSHCLPTCNGVNYDISITVYPLEKAVTKTYHRGLLKGFNNSKPLSIIKLYFQKRFAQSTEMNIVGDWVVLLNRFGGIMGLMFGFSLISYIEIIYYISGKWFFDIYNSPPPPDNNLYWQELQPKCISIRYY